jgi:Tol biopolymer transport system component
LELDVSVAGYPFCLSPDSRKLAFLAGRGDGTSDLYVVPVSLKDGRTTGPEAIVFSGWDPKISHDRAFSWSPDGAKVALSHNGDIWMASADGGDPVQVTTKGRFEYLPVWSPDGEMIKYVVSVQEGTEKNLRVIPASGSEDTIILDVPGIGDAHWWSADSKDILFRRA